VNEPTAAALAYVCMRKSVAASPYTILAAARFDISILKLISTTDGDIFQVYRPTETPIWGGDDIDQRVASVAREEIRSQGVDLAVHT